MWRPRPVDRAGRRERGEGLVAEGERRVGADRRVDERDGAGLALGVDLPREALVLADAGQRPLPAVAVGRLVAEHAAQADGVEALAQDVERAVDELGAGVVVDHRRDADHGGVGRAREAARPDDALVEGAVEAPPQVPELLGEVLARLDAHHQAPGERRVEVVVRADETRADVAAGREPLRPGVLRREARADLDDLAAVDRDVLRPGDGAGVEMEQADVLDDDHALPPASR